MCGSGGAQRLPHGPIDALECLMVSRGLVAAACAAALVQGGLLSKRHEAWSKGAGRTRGAAAPAASRQPRHARRAAPTTPRPPRRARHAAPAARVRS